MQEMKLLQSCPTITTPTVKVTWYVEYDSEGRRGLIDSGDIGGGMRIGRV